MCTLHCVQSQRPWLNGSDIFKVAPNEALMAIVEHLPSTTAQLGRLRGWSEKGPRLAEYGQTFLDEVALHRVAVACQRARARV